MVIKKKYQTEDLFKWRKPQESKKQKSLLRKSTQPQGRHSSISPSLMLALQKPWGSVTGCHCKRDHPKKGGQKIKSSLLKIKALKTPRQPKQRASTHCFRLAHLKLLFTDARTQSSVAWEYDFLLGVKIIHVVLDTLYRNKSLLYSYSKHNSRTFLYNTIIEQHHFILACCYYWIQTVSSQKQQLSYTSHSPAKLGSDYSFKCTNLMHNYIKRITGLKQ